MGLYIEMSASDPEIYWIHRRLICLFSPRRFNCDQYPLQVPEVTRTYTPFR
jgi:hypothetical protein